MTVETLITQLKISLKLTFWSQPLLLDSLPKDSNRTACTSSAISRLPRQQVQAANSFRSECMQRQGRMARAPRLCGQEAGKMEERHPISWVSTQRGTLCTFMQLSDEDLWIEQTQPAPCSNLLLSLTDLYDIDFCQVAMIAAVLCGY